MFSSFNHSQENRFHQAGFLHSVISSLKLSKNLGNILSIKYDNKSLPGLFKFLSSCRLMTEQCDSTTIVVFVRGIRVKLVLLPQVRSFSPWYQFLMSYDFNVARLSPRRRSFTSLIYILRISIKFLPHSSGVILGC